MIQTKTIRVNNVTGERGMGFQKLQQDVLGHLRGIYGENITAEFCAAPNSGGVEDGLIVHVTIPAATPVS